MSDDAVVESDIDGADPTAATAAGGDALETETLSATAGIEAEGAFAGAAESAAYQADDGEERDEESGDDAELPPLPFVSIVEAILFAAREPLKPAQIARAIGKGTRREAVRDAVDELNVQYLENGRAFEIAEISGRFQLMSRPEYVDYIKRIYPKRDPAEKDRMTRLSPSALDTLAIIAYKQPVTRGEIEHIRGVGCGPVLRALMERGAVKVAGKAQLVGQPWLYGTTEAFLAEFGLGSLDELPLRGEFFSLVGGTSEGVAEIGSGLEERRAGDEGNETNSALDMGEDGSDGGDGDETPGDAPEAATALAIPLTQSEESGADADKGREQSGDREKAIRN